MLIKNIKNNMKLAISKFDGFDIKELSTGFSFRCKDVRSINEEVVEYELLYNEADDIIYSKKGDSIRNSWDSKSFVSIFNS